MKKQLTDQQRRAAESPAPLLTIVAGPGSGKTTTLVERVSYKLDMGTQPSDCALITFTNAAANEMAHRLSQHYGGATVKLGYCGTLHGFMLRLLAKHGESIGLHGNITVMDENQSKEMLTDIAKENRCRASITSLREQVEDVAREWMVIREHISPTVERLVAIEYRRRMLAEATLDYDAVLHFGARLLESTPVSFTDLFVDEFQDSGEWDALIYNILRNKHGKIYKTFVGDVDQSIYGFRGGSPNYMMSITRRKDCQTILLEDNFRCGQEICRVANNLIECNKNRIKKRTNSFDGTDSATVITNEFFNSITELDFIAKRLLAIGPETWNECAVLLRSNFLVNETSDFLVAHGISVRAREGTRFPEDFAKCRRFIALLANPQNDRMAYWWLKETRGERTATEIKLASLANYTSINDGYLKIPEGISLESLPAGLTRGKFSIECISLVEDVIHSLPEDSTIAELLVALNVTAFRHQEAGNGVTITTLHSAKGREWDSVFLPAFEQQVIPGERKSVDLEEERRLAFVGITRARKCLWVSWARERRLNEWQKQPQEVTVSQFVKEMESGC